MSDQTVALIRCPRLVALGDQWTRPSGRSKRVDALLQALLLEPRKPDNLILVTPDQATEQVLCRVHSKQYVGEYLSL